MVLHVINKDKLPSFLLSMKLKHFHGREVSLEPEVKQKTIANKQNLIEELISVWACNDKIRNDCMELVHSIPALLWHLTESKAHLPNTVLGLVFCHRV